MNHVCNSGCRNGEHCELVYSNAESIGVLMDALVAHCQYTALQVIRAEVAREALPYEEWIQSRPEHRYSFDGVHTRPDNQLILSGALPYLYFFTVDKEMEALIGEVRPRHE